MENTIEEIKQEIIGVSSGRIHENNPVSKCQELERFLGKINSNR